MFTFKVGKPNIRKQSNIIKWFLQALTLFILLLVIIFIVLQFYSDPIKDITKSLSISSRTFRTSSQSAEGPCLRKKVCPTNRLSFFIQSGAANVVPPKICVNNELVLGAVLNNAGSGINIVVVNGKTGEILKTDFFNMYSGKVEPLIEFLKNIETGSMVLMAVYDEGSRNLNDEAKKLIADLGSSMIQTLGYRDNWVFAGGKGSTGKGTFEKKAKNDKSTNTYEEWPEMVEVEGCIPTYIE
ncbi:protein FAM3C-like [Girardinichthys multiradiatus]|uniref:protein FAM3C-like n=1 Tax=Girardinichthys multiradiatus TaxID=208333 RepID=UPI001FAE3727|nr:protein FAM3C-like [Girardinichthys multiradiatus]